MNRGKLWTYSGPATLTAGERSVHVGHVQLKEEIDYIEEINGRGVVVREPGLRHWGGSARVAGLLYGLLDVLGEVCRIRLPDGSTGRCHVTGSSEDSVWVVEIDGIGPTPR